MRSVNKVILIGNLTRDPEMKTTQSNQPLTTFGIATNRTWTNGTGQTQTSTEFHELVAWARLAEFANSNLSTGKLVYIEGYLKTRSWETDEGIRRFKTEIVVQDLIILSKKADGTYEEGESVSLSDEELDAAEPDFDGDTDNSENQDDLF